MNEISEIKSPCLQPCALAFQANMTRVCVFSMMPAALTWDRVRDGIVTANALKDRKEPPPLKSVISGGTPMSQSELMEAARQLAEFSNWAPKEQNDAMWVGGVMVVDQLANRHEAMGTSMRALFTSVVLESWLFFEALCSDLWVAAVDNSNGLIAGRVADSTAQFKRRDEPLKVEKMVSNFQSHPGSFWREAGKVAFQTKKDIQSFFQMAFGEAIQSALNKTSSGDIWTLNAFRNCFAHSAGKVDPTFQRQAAHDAQFRDLPLRSQLPLDGEICARLRNAALATGTALLRTVDQMLLNGD